MLAHLITEPELSAAMAFDATLEADVDEDRLIAALAYEAAPESADCWIPARRRPTAGVALPIA